MRLSADMIGPMSIFELYNKYFVRRGRIKINSERTSLSSGSPASYNATKFLIISNIRFDKKAIFYEKYVTDLADARFTKLLELDKEGV